MNIIKTNIEGVLVLEPRIYRDARGYFFESFSKQEFDEKVARIDFVEETESFFSKRDVSGLHFQKPPYDQSILVRCVAGKILYIAVDIRKGSLTYGHHVSVEITEENHYQMFIPKGFAHGYAILSETGTLQYKCDNYTLPEAQQYVSVFDESVKIDFNPVSLKANVKEGEQGIIPLKDFESPFEFRIPIKVY